MSKQFRPIEHAEETVENVRQTAQTARERIEDYLFGTFTCNECGARCEPSERFVQSQAMVMATWDCPNCDMEYYRESPVDESNLQPRER